MAVDETLLDGYAETRVDDSPRPPTLRLYGWQPAALSLGRAQSAEGLRDPYALRRAGIDLVRRPSGGRAVLHEFERTYAVIGRLRTPPFAGGVLQTYDGIARALIRGLGLFGVVAQSAAAPRSARPTGAAAVACFASPSTHEIVVSGSKLVGSAQVRRRGAFLQHGSILLRADPERLGLALDATALQGFTDLERLTGGPIDVARLDRCLIDGFAGEFGAEMQQGALNAAELLAATRLRSWKYDSAAWTLDARIGERERRWGREVWPR
jgi:lipoate-protein ligase A